MKVQEQNNKLWVKELTLNGLELNREGLELTLNSQKIKNKLGIQETNREGLELTLQVQELNNKLWVQELRLNEWAPRELPPGDSLIQRLLKLNEQELTLDHRVRGENPSYNLVEELLMPNQPKLTLKVQTLTLNGQELLLKGQKPSLGEPKSRLRTQQGLADALKKQAQARQALQQQSMLLGIPAFCCIFMLALLLGQRNKISLTLTGQLIIIFPEEWVAELEASHQLLKSQERSIWVIRKKMLKAVVQLLWAYFQINVENLWLPKSKGRNKIDK
ncbi:hypothetical protein H6G04_30195 [Calothrix membranacea FACHB-236]|nr:hypothetical protein [Calothrix membranacea FACHB-236]